MFRVSFQFANRTYTATVQEINSQPAEFVVFKINPWMSCIPEKLVYISSPEDDQLFYRGFTVQQIKLLAVIGESIFLACHQQKIAVHA